MKKVFKAVGMTLYAAILLFVAYFVLSLIWYFMVLYLHVDFSQDYRQVEGAGNIVFIQCDEPYKRTFWGLKRIDMDVASLEEPESMIESEEYQLLINTVGKKNVIQPRCLSPDGNWLLYKEYIRWGQGAPTDDEDVYFRAFNINDGRIVTIFGGAQQFFDAYWE